MRKISIIAALVILYTSNTFAMLDTDYMGLQFMKLKVGDKGGELKCIANLIESGLEKYDTYEKSNPVLAKSVLKGSMVLAKGIVGVIASRSPMGFLGGMATGTVQELQGVFVSGLLGHSLNNIVNKVVDTTAPWLMKLDPLLDVREAKILACAVMGASMTLCEFGAVGKIVRCSTRPKGTNFAFFEAKIEQSIAHNIKESIVHNIKESFHTLVHGSMSQLQEESLEKLVLQGSKVVPISTTTTKAESASKKLLEQSKQDLGSFLTEILQEQVHKDVQTSCQTGQLEKSTSAAKQMQSVFEQEQEYIRYQVMHNTVADTFEGFSAIASITGNHEEAFQIATLGNASIKLMDSCHMLSTGASSIASLGGIVTTSCIAPYVGIASAVASLVSLFGGRSNGLGKSLQQINKSIVKMHKSLSQQISVVHTHMLERFDHLEDKVDSMHVHMVQGFLQVIKRFDYLEQKVDHMHTDMIKGFVGMAECFQKMSEQMQDSTALNVYALEHINSDLQALHKIDAKIDSLLLSPFIDSCSAIEHYPSRFGSLSIMDKQEVVSHYKTLENTILGVNPAYAHLNGYTCTDFSPITMNRILGSSFPEFLLGYLAHYSTSQLGISLPHAVDPSQLPNLRVFVCGLEKYVTLRRATAHIPYDDQCKIIQNIAHAGDHALTFIHAVQSNGALFAKLKARYDACREKVLTLYCQALEQKSQEIYDRVYTDIIKKAHESIDKAPIYKFNQEYILEAFQNLPPIFNSAKTNIESFLEAKRVQAHRDLDAWLAQYKQLLPPNCALSYPSSVSKINLTQSIDEMKKCIDDISFYRPIILNAIALPEINHEQQLKHGFPPIPLYFGDRYATGTFRGGAYNRSVLVNNEFKQYVSPLAILAERLGLGTIEFRYIMYENNTIRIRAILKTQDNREVRSGGVDLSILESPIQVPSPESAFKAIINGSYSHPVASQALYADFRRIMRDVSRLWGNLVPTAEKSGWADRAPFGYDTNELTDLVVKGLAKHRQDALATLFTPTALGISFQQALEEFNSVAQAMQAFATVAGLNKKLYVTDPINSSICWSQQSLHDHMVDKYANNECADLRAGFREPHSTMQVIQETFGLGPLNIFGSARMGPLVPKDNENSFSKPLLTGLARLNLFAVSYPELLRQRQAAIDSEVQQRRQKEIDSMAIMTSGQPATSQELARATQEIRDLKAQMVAMTSMVQQMQQLLLQRK